MHIHAHIQWKDIQKFYFKKKALMLKDKDGIGSREQGEKIALFE